MKINYRDRIGEIDDRFIFNPLIRRAALHIDELPNSEDWVEDGEKMGFHNIEKDTNDRLAEKPRVGCPWRISGVAYPMFKMIYQAYEMAVSTASAGPSKPTRR